MLKRDRLIHIGRRSAELVKYACNAFLATKISFINEISRLSECVGANIQEIREGMISDSRIGDQFLFPGIGYGGSCLPKDTHSLIAQGHDVGIEMGIIKAADDVNKLQKNWIFKKILAHFKNKINDKVIAVWGLSFKPNTDDLRDAPSVELLRNLFQNGAIVQAHDPAALPNLKNLFQKEVSENRLRLFPNAYDATKDADVLAVLTEWQEYRSPNFKKISRNLNESVIFDGRAIYDQNLLHRFGVTHYAVGVRS